MKRKDSQTIAIIAVIIVAAALLVVGLATAPSLSPPEQQNKTLYNITKDGVQYVFTTNIYDALNVPIYDKERVYSKLALAQRIWILFRDEGNNSMLAAASFDVTSKLVHYYVYTQGRIVNITGAEISQLNGTLQGTFIEFRGPTTGANETSIRYNRGVIIVQALNSSDLRTVADRLTLVLFEDDLRALNVTIPASPVEQASPVNASNSSNESS